MTRWLDGAGLAFLHLADTNAWAGSPDYAKMLPLPQSLSRAACRECGYNTERAAEIVASGEADAVAFGRLFLANPDLPARIRKGGPYNDLHHVGVYGGSDVGYLDYPTLALSIRACLATGEKR